MTVTADLKHSGKLGLTDAAKIMQELGICKAFGPRGNLNGPNCQRFGHRDPETGRWWWGVSELANEARRRGKASEQLIESVLMRFARPSEESAPAIVGSRNTLNSEKPKSRAQIEMEFRETVCELESLLRKVVGGESRDTLGKLIGKAEKLRLFPRFEISELSSINEVRKCLFHPSEETVDDDGLKRVLASVVARLDSLRRNL